MFSPDKLPILHRMQSIARRVQEMRYARACKEYGLAFGNPNGKELNMCIIHNSILAREEGKPWREVDYSHMRNAKRIVNDFRDSRLVESWYRRQCGFAS